ncbi:hypothetical protein AEGHOMDF_4323 [Methylobacterium soli]|nr:hypothetical protein AEGHOMDF_4323 [Methylobacterium soli]
MAIVYFANHHSRTGEVKHSVIPGLRFAVSG